MNQEVGLAQLDHIGVLSLDLQHLEITREKFCCSQVIQCVIFVVAAGTDEDILHTRYGFKHLACTDSAKTPRVNTRLTAYSELRKGTHRTHWSLVHGARKWQNANHG